MGVEVTISGTIGGMTDGPSPKDSPEDEEARLDEALRVLNALPPEVVKQALLDAGVMEGALDVLKDLARNSEDLEIRAEARRTIREYGLEGLGAVERCPRQRL